jgi:hypothetical protein
MGLFFLDSCTDPFFPPDHKSTRSTSRSKMFRAWIYWKRRVLWYSLLPPISLSALVRRGSGHIFAQFHTPLNALDSLLNVADVDGGLCTATGTSKCTPPPHPQSLTRLRSDLNFWIQKVKVLENSTSGFSFNIFSGAEDRSRILPWQAEGSVPVVSQILQGRKLAKGPPNAREKYWGNTSQWQSSTSRHIWIVTAMNILRAEITVTVPIEVRPCVPTALLTGYYVEISFAKYVLWVYWILLYGNPDAFICVSIASSCLNPTFEVFLQASINLSSRCGKSQRPCNQGCFPWCSFLDLIGHCFWT